MIKYKRKLNIIAGEPPEPIRLGQYDDDVVLEFELYSSEGILTMEPDTAVAIRGIKPDGNGISVEGTLKTTKDKYTKAETYIASFDVTKQMTACAGECKYKLVLGKDGKELNTCSFLIIVDRASLDKDVLPSESEIREIMETLDRTDDLLKASRSITKAKKEIDEAVKTVQSAKDEVANAVDAVTALKMEILALKDDFSAESDDMDEKIKALNTAGAKILEEIEDAGASIDADFEKKKSALKTASEDMLKSISADSENALTDIKSAKGAALGEIDSAKMVVINKSDSVVARLDIAETDMLKNITANGEKSLTEIEKAEKSAVGNLGVTQQTALDQIDSMLSQIAKTKDDTANVLTKMTETMDAITKTVGELEQAHKDLKTRVEHMEFEMFKTGGEEA